MKLSYSSTQKYVQCARAWWLGNHRQLAPVNAERTGALGFGGRIHSAMEAWAKGDVAAPIDAWRELSAHEEAIVAERDGFGAEALEKETLLGAVMTEGFVDWWETEGDDQEFEVMAIEKQFNHELEVITPQGEVVDIMLYGKLDQLLRHRDSGQWWIRDYKTTKNLAESAISGVEWSPQGRLYARLTSQNLGVDVTGIRYTFLRKVLQSARAKPPFYFNYDMHMSDYNVDHHVRRVAAVAGKMLETTQALDRGVDPEVAAPFNVDWWCKTCPFRNVCYVMQTAGMEEAEDMLADQFEVRDPMERYESEDDEVTF